ncbi:MAG: hypothetical protein N2Z21_10900 [Candidatus Sumerlaeaceae bacterium]|nr:hypothetical protein [Candidatus Sumerlaeaceae bacterium]
MKPRLWRHGLSILVVLNLWAALVVVGEVIQSGPWSGRTLLPIGPSDPAIAESAFAAAIVCRHASSNYERLALFESLSQTTSTMGTPFFAVIQVANEDQIDVVEEVANQRGIRIPLFATTDDFLGSRDFAVFLLTQGRVEEIPEFSADRLVGAIASKRPSFSAVQVGEAPTTSSVVLPARNPLYVNQRYEFSVRWPKGWNYKIARNNDGAVGVPPSGSALEARVWAAPELKSSDPTDPPAYVQIKDYLNYLKSQARGDIKVETKLKVFDGDIEGRDYTYTYIRAGKDGKPDEKYRGRVQAFVVDGVAKMISVEGPEDEFKREEDTIDKFIYSFHPTIE